MLTRLIYWSRYGGMSDAWKRVGDRYCQALSKKYVYIINFQKCHFCNDNKFCRKTAKPLQKYMP